MSSHVRSAATPFTFSMAWYIGTVPTGTGQLRTIHSRVSWMCLPVERSISVSPPHLQLHTAFSTSSSMVEVVAELPMFVLIFTRKLRPIIIGSASGWLMLAGITARPAATSWRTNSGVMWVAMPSASQSMFSRMATYSISGVMMPWRAKASCVMCAPALARSGRWWWEKRRLSRLRSANRSRQ